MFVNFYFLRDKFNYYSFPPLLAALEKLPFVYATLVSRDFIENFNSNKRDNLYNVFGFSYNTLSFQKDIIFLKNVIPKLKKQKAVLLAGGPQATASPLDFLSLGFDAVVRGDGEVAILKIAKLLHYNKVPQGIFTHKINNLDPFPPFPDNKAFYKPIEITRGCPFACNYCQTSFIFSSEPIHRSIENIKVYVEKAFFWGYKDFRFISPNALGYGTKSDKADLEKLYLLLSTIRSVIKKEGRLFFGSFPSEIRPDFVTKEAMLLLRKFVDNKRIIIGAQSASERMLTLSKRGHTLKDVETAIENSLSAGFQVDIDLIIGMPDEKEEDLHENIIFIEKYASKNVKFHLHYFMPLPGTPWRNKLPTPISNHAIKSLKRLTGMGKVWGVWLKQKNYTNQ